MVGRSPPTSPSKHLNERTKRRRLASHSITNAATASNIASRVIIALDLDAFYVSACRKRDPSLIGIPIGIQQKALVATISYEAREAGVNKLDSIKDALSKCPDMVLVNGEDLTYFRQVSAQVCKLVRSIVWGKKVEKLGMDELFCDVTDMVNHHLGSLQPGTSSASRWFDLNRPDAEQRDDAYGFEYKAWPTDCPGHVYPSEAAAWLDRNQPDQWQERMLTAAQLAFHLRQRISNEVGLTCSAGIAPSKSLAKLVGALNKPNQQTTFAPPIVGSIASPSANFQNGSATDEARLLHHINGFLDPLELRKLPGFGRVVVDKVRDHLHPPDPSSAASHSKGSARVNFMDPASLSDEEAESKKVRVSVGTARKMLSAEEMIELFGEVIGPKLWALVCGRDTEPVIPAPDFPLQLSIEDTYPYPSLRGAAIHAEMSRLSLSLLRRLELELTSDPSHPEQKPPTPLSQETAIKGEAVIIRDYREEPSAGASAGTRNWLRYPMKLRLSVRQGWNNRISKQTKMPVEIFDLHQPREARARAIAKACRGLLRAIIGGDDVVGDGMNLINIAALELSERRPQRALGSFFALESRAHKTVKLDTMSDGQDDISWKGEIDEAFLASLPPELRDDIAQEYGLDLSTTALISHDALSMQRGIVESVGTGQTTEGKGKAKASPTGGLICVVCGEEMQVWMQHDHEQYPLSGLPTPPPMSYAVFSPDEGAYNDGGSEEGSEPKSAFEADLVRCEVCGEELKSFMVVAHGRFHELQHPAY